MTRDQIKLVKVTSDDCSWKGTWYRRGRRYFVVQDPRWPHIVTSRWSSVDICGGINESDCRVLRGPIAWLACKIKAFMNPTTTEAGG